jgi:6-phosphogluconate dehydrogenase
MIVPTGCGCDGRSTRAIAMMRHGFGGHPYGDDGAIRHERQYGRVGGFYREGE